MDPKKENPEIEFAAGDLYAEMQRMDPVGAPAWKDLSEGDRHVYLTFVEVVLSALAAKGFVIVKR